MWIKEEDPSHNLKLIVCGDMNGGDECGAVHYLQSGSIGPDFLEDGEQVTSKKKVLPLSSPLLDAALADGLDRSGASPPATLVVAELISLMIDEGNIETCYIEPQFSKPVLDRFHRIYQRFATVSKAGAAFNETTERQMGKSDVERWLTAINGRVGRGSEFRNAARYMGWVESPFELDKLVDAHEYIATENCTNTKNTNRPPIVIPDDGILTLEDFIGVYIDELRQGKFWGIAWDLARLNEPLPLKDVFRARYDRIFCSAPLLPVAVLDTLSDHSCPNKSEPSDHLPIAASFRKRQM